MEEDIKPGIATVRSSVPIKETAKERSFIQLEFSCGSVTERLLLSLMEDLPHFVGRHCPNTDGDDDEQVEGRRANNRSRSKISGFEILRVDLNHRQQDFWSRGTERHQCQVRNSFIPDSDRDDLRLSIRCVDSDLKYEKRCGRDSH